MKKGKFSSFIASTARYLSHYKKTAESQVNYAYATDRIELSFKFVGCNDIHLDEAIAALVKALAMNMLDIVIIVIMIFLIVRGLFRGFFMEIASLAGVILGILLGLRLNPQMTGFLRPHLPSFDEFVLQLASFAIILLVVLVLCNLTGKGLKILLKKTSLGWADKGLGAGLAVLKGIIVTYIAIVILTFLVPSKAPLVARSKLAPWVITSYQSIISLISPDFYQSWKRRFKEQKKKIDKVVSKKIEGFTGEDGS